MTVKAPPLFDSADLSDKPQRLAVALRALYVCIARSHCWSSREPQTISMLQSVLVAGILDRTQIQYAVIQIVLTTATVRIFRMLFQTAIESTWKTLFDPNHIVNKTHRTATYVSNLLDMAVSF